MTQVCLVIPPSPFLLDERVFVSLGILRIAAVLEQQGVPIDVLDLSGIANESEALSSYIRKEEKTHLFAFTATTPQMPNAFRLSQQIRRESPHSRLILGGPHPTLVYAALKKERHAGRSGRAARAAEALEKAFDVIVAGDGERAIFEAIKPNASGWIDADDPKSNLFLTNVALNDLPFPARHLIDLGSYHYQIDGVPATSLIAQLGCPFQCGFCGGRNSPMLRRVRTRTTQNVVDEILSLHRDYGVNGFMLYDDELNVNPQMIPMMNAISEAQDGLGVQFKLRGFIKAQLFTMDQARAMYRAGFRWILTGFESGSERILENINKRATRQENTRCVEIAHQAGLKVKALMSIGHPGESRQTIQETRDWLLENKPDDFDVTIITPYPGSPYYDDALFEDGAWTYRAASGDKLFATEVDYFKEADYYKSGPGDYKSYVWTETLSPQELVQERDRLERDIRERLALAYNPGKAAIRFEHSMGQGLPEQILKRGLSLTAAS